MNPRRILDGHIGRRSTKKVYLWSGGGYSASPSVDLRFIYDAWNLVGELNAANNNPIRSYVWGQDLSGSLQGAGGIGGLLVVRDHGAGTYHFAGYDGNGNVTVLVNAADQGLSAQYEYSPFGDVLRATGLLARSSPFRFSTKFLDEETDLVYYGYRYYSPNLMRWVNRDPIAERGGLNLYGFLANAPLTFVDIDGRGLYDFLRHGYRPVFTAVMLSLGADTGIPWRGSPAAALQKQQALMEHVEDVRRGRNKSLRRGSSVGALALAGTLVAMETGFRASAAMVGVVGGAAPSSDPVQRSMESYFHNLINGDAGMADLDAVTAALEMTGGVGADALIAWGVLEIAGEVFSSFF